MTRTASGSTEWLFLQRFLHCVLCSPLSQGSSQKGLPPLCMKFLRHQVGPSSRKHLLTGAHNSALPMFLVIFGKLAALLRREKQRDTFMAGRENVKALARVGNQGKVRESLGEGFLESPQTAPVW